MKRCQGTIHYAVCLLLLTAACSDDCRTCCECVDETSGPGIVYEPNPSDECMSCDEQCAELEKREEVGSIERVEEVECSD